MNSLRIVISFGVAVVLIAMSFCICGFWYELTRVKFPIIERGLKIDGEEVFLPPLDPFVKLVLPKPNDIPTSHFYPPPPPVGGIYSVLEGITDEDVGEARALEYILTYYPLVGLEDDVVSQLNDQQRAEYKRQNDALDKEIFGSDYTLIKRVGSVLRVPIAVLNILRQE